MSYSTMPLREKMLTHCELDISPLWTNSSDIAFKMQKFVFDENAFRWVVCKTSAILFRPWCVKQTVGGRTVYRVMKSVWTAPCGRAAHLDSLAYI